jgi:hypothetical protein
VRAWSGHGGSRVFNDRERVREREKKKEEGRRLSKGRKKEIS